MAMLIERKYIYQIEQAGESLRIGNTISKIIQLNDFVTKSKMGKRR